MVEMITPDVESLPPVTRSANGFAYPKNLPDSDGIPMELPWHRDCMNQLLEAIDAFRTDRDSYYLGGNEFFYFSLAQVKKNEFLGPDVFLVNNIKDGTKPRRYWAVWDEDYRYPDFIAEICSPSTEKNDRTKKFAIYEQTFKTHEYLIYNSETRKIGAYRLDADGKYQPIEPNQHGHWFSEAIGAHVGEHEGHYGSRPGRYLRLFDANGILIPDHRERERIEAQQQRVEAERQRVEAERQREIAELERQRADEAVAELARMREELERLRGAGQ